MPRIFAIVCLGLLAGCAGAPTEEQPPPVEGVESGNAPFDQDRSAALLARADAATDRDEALALYREAALAWPDNVEAWRGLSASAAAAGRPQEGAAADFMVERATLYPSDALYVQREIDQALDAWIARQRQAPEANPVEITYAETLSSFYDWRYAARGTYDPPRPFLNVRPRDIPAVIVSAGGLLGYLGSVALGASEDTAQ